VGDGGRKSRRRREGKWEKIVGDGERKSRRRREGKWEKESESGGARAEKF